MTRYLMIAAAVLGPAGVATAQFQQPGYPSGYPQGYYPPTYSQSSPFGPNVYNPQNQPLSPYLNLLRGGNAGVNYYYGVRPGTTGGSGGGIGAPFTASGGYRPPFFPQLVAAP